MFKKLIALVLLSTLITAGFAVTVLVCPWVSKRFIPVFVHAAFGNVRIKDLDIARQTFRYPDRLMFKNVKGVVVLDDTPYTISLPAATITGQRLFSSSARKAGLNIRKADISSPVMSARGVDAEVSSIGLFSESSPANGVFTIENIQSLGYALTDARGAFAAAPGRLTISPFEGKLYGGQGKADVLVTFEPEPAYVVKAQISGVDIKMLEEVNPAVFSNMKGTVAGDIAVNGDSRGIRGASGSLWSGPGAEVKAFLLKPLLDYIPQSTQKKELERLIATAGNISLDTATLAIKDLTDERISTKINLKSKKFNLDIGLALDLNIEGGLNNLLKLQEQFFTKEGDL